MQIVSKIWMDGKFVCWNKAKTHILTHTLHYGAGVFEGIRFYETDNGQAIFRLDEHLERLFYSAKKIGLEIPYTKNQLETAILKLIKINKLKSGYIRPLAYYGYGKMGIDPRGCPTNVSIAIWPWGVYLSDKPARCKISPFIRLHPKSVHNEAKVCGHYINSIVARLNIDLDQHDEVILFDHKNHLAEGSAENIFIVKNGVLFTPKPGSILIGITRDTVMVLARDARIPCEEKDITKQELLAADEVFFAGTAAEISPIASIDGHYFGNGETGPLSQKIKNTYAALTRGKIDKYKDWLTFL